MCLKKITRLRRTLLSIGRAGKHASLDQLSNKLIVGGGGGGYVDFL